MMSSLVIDPPSWEIGRLGIYLEAVSCGCKPAAAFAVHRLQVPCVLDELARSKLKWIQHQNGGHHFEFWIFEHEHMRHVINREIGLPYNRDVFGIWLNGKIFGYSEEKIARFITEQNNSLK